MSYGLKDHPKEFTTAVSAVTKDAEGFTAVWSSCSDLLLPEIGPATVLNLKVFKTQILKFIVKMWALLMIYLGSTTTH